MEKKVIPFALYGRHSQYILGAVANATTFCQDKFQNLHGIDTGVDRAIFATRL